MRFIIGDKGIDFVRQYDEIKDEAIYYDDKKGFSKTQRWIDFVIFVNQINVFFKDILQKYEIIIERFWE